MQIETLLYIIIAGIIALLVALFQYVYKFKKNNHRFLFSSLRFLTVFLLLLLLINPKVEKTSLYTEKPNLVVALDNTESIVHLGRSSAEKTVLEEIRSNQTLSDHFNIAYYSLGNGIAPLEDSLTFSGTETNIDKAFKEFSQIFRSTISPTILISDGNQTFGSDYQFSTQTYKQSIYPIILGDTVTYSDLKISKLNVNKYAYLKNKFPIEIVLIYNGYSSVNSQLNIFQGSTIVHSENLSFSKTDNSKISHFTLPANSVGVQQYRAEITPLTDEKNIINNTKNFAVEVIDQKQRIAIVSAFTHPDLGLFKKSIESNEQREVSILKPQEAISQIDDFHLVVLYQPDNSFKLVYQKIQEAKKNTLTVVGTKTNINLLNKENTNFNIENTNQKEEYQVSLNSSYSNFIIDDINFENFPPLKSVYGNVNFSTKTDIILYKKLRTAITTQPMLATFEVNGRREGVLFGENIWQWRANSYLETNSFEAFDDFIGKLVQFLASNRSRNRLLVDYESFYNGNSHVIVSAQFFNKNYEFDGRESLYISVKNVETEEVREIPFILKGNNYQVDLSGLSAGKYNFTVTAQQENISYSSNFTILEYNVEQQFLNANVTKLNQLATDSDGESFFVDNYSALFEKLITDERYKPIQKSIKNKVPLIDYKYLLALIVLLLSAEWFARKYNGLI